MRHWWAVGIVSIWGRRGEEGVDWGWSGGGIGKPGEHWNRMYSVILGRDIGECPSSRRKGKRVVGTNLFIRDLLIHSNKSRRDNRERDGSRS